MIITLYVSLFTLFCTLVNTCSIYVGKRCLFGYCDMQKALWSLFANKETQLILISVYLKKKKSHHYILKSENSFPIPQLPLGLKQGKGLKLYIFKI